MGIFTDFYNTVAKFFRPHDEQEDASKSVATNRLKLVLMQDRTNLTPRILEQMRGELIDLLSRYVELDKELLELNFEHEGDQVALMLSIPVIRAKDEEEIEAALKAEAEKLEEKIEELKDNSEENETDEEAEEETEEKEANEVEAEESDNQTVSTPEEMSSSSSEETEEKKEEKKEEVSK